MLKTISKSLSHFFYLVLAKIFVFVFRRSSKRGVYKFARKIAFLWFLIDKRHREAALSGLSYAFNGSMTKKQVRELALESFRSMSKSAAEMGYFLGKPGQVRESVRIEGVCNLQEGLAAGKGVILVSAHFGNFVLLLARLCLEGYKTHVVMRPLKNREIEKIFLPEARRIGLTPIYSIPRQACVQEALKALRRNEILFIPVDQNFGTGGIYVDFFNRKAATATGPVVFAERTGAAIVPCFIIRNPDDTHTIRIEPVLKLDRGADHQEYLHTALQKITGIIEGFIRAYPQEWTWIHRRWKSRPAAERCPRR